MTPSTEAFLKATKTRRSIYQLAPESPIPDSRITQIVTEALLDCPSTFNTQSTRAVVILRHEHTKLWNIITDIIEFATPAEEWETFAKARFEGFSKGYGTVSCLIAVFLGSGRAAPGSEISSATRAD